MTLKARLIILVFLAGSFLFLASGVRAQLCCAENCRSPQTGCCGELYECGNPPDPPSGECTTDADCGQGGGAAPASATRSGAGQRRRAPARRNMIAGIQLTAIIR